MVKEFDMDMNVGIEAKPPFYKIRVKCPSAGGPVFIVTKKIDIVRSAMNGLLDIKGFWAKGDEKSYDLENKDICSIILPVNNIDYIENLMYRPR